MTEAELNAIDSDLSRASEAWVNEHGRKLVAEIRRLQVDNTTRAGYYARSHDEFNEVYDRHFHLSDPIHTLQPGQTSGRAGESQQEYFGLTLRRR